MPYVYSPLSCVCVLCVLFFICVSVGVCSCSFAGGRVWFYWRMCASLMYMPLMSLVFLSCLSFFVLWVFVAQVVCAFWGFVFLGCFFGVLGGCLWGVFFVFWRVSGVLFCWGGGFWGWFLFGRCGSIVCFVFWACALAGERLGGLCRGCYVWRSFCGWFFICAVAPFSFLGWESVFLGVCSGWCVRFVGLFLWCAGVWVVFLVSLRGVSLHVSLVCGVGWLGGCVLGLWL